MNELPQNHSADHLPILFNAAEIATLQTLHRRYQIDHDCFTEGERLRLQFLRWLHESGRIQSMTQSTPEADV